jgi:hypothetical protein
MPDTLLSIFPKPEDLLALQPEDLAGVIHEIVPGVMQNGMFNTGALLAQLFSPIGNRYPPGVHEQVRLAIAEALSWLTNQGLVMLDPDQPAGWYRPTRRGSQLKTRADVEAFRRGDFPRPEGPQNNVVPGAPGADPNLSFATDTPLALRSRSNLGGALAGPTEVFPLMNPPADDRSPAVSGGAAAEAGASGAQPAVPVQSYLVTTPLGSNAELISLTLRFDPVLHNIVSDAVPELLRADIEGWTREALGSGDALLDRLAGDDQSLRAAIVEALDNRAAVLRFSNPTPFHALDLKRIKEGIVAFSKLPLRTAVVGVFMMGACLIAVQVSWGVGAGLSATAEYAVIEVGKALVDQITARIRETDIR